MQLRRRLIIAAILVIVCISIRVYSADSLRVENGYSTHFFAGLASFLRMLFGWLPFSIGDIFYGLAVLWLLVKLFSGLQAVLRKRTRSAFKTGLYKKLLKAVIILSAVYIIFNLFWGINYNRKGIAWQLSLKIEPYSTADLREMNCMLIDKINSSKTALLRENRAYPSNKELVLGVSNAYRQLGVQYQYLNYKPASLKSSLWGWLGNYTGFTGYYDPFTGEAQLNTTIPRFLLPYTACHEVAHQLGYAKEMEANFVGYLAAAASADTLFHYSVYLDLFTYANRNLYFTDSSSAKIYRKELLPAVVTDIKEWIAFSRKHENPVEPIIRWGYGVFLKSNQQPQGILSYDEVTGFIISYYKKFGRL